MTSMTTTLLRIRTKDGTERLSALLATVDEVPKPPRTLPPYQGPAERELGGVRRPAVLPANYPSGRPAPPTSSAGRRLGPCLGSNSPAPQPDWGVVCGDT